MTAGTCPGCHGLRKELYVIRGLQRCRPCVKRMRKKPDRKQGLYEVPARK